MQQNVTRRRFLEGLAVGGTIVGLNPLTKLWVTSAHAHGSGAVPVPRLDGVLLTDAASRQAAGQDAGGIVFETPRAVLRPGSVRDIQKMIRFCMAHGMQVAARGQGHTVFGQAQVGDGLVIDMSTLDAIDEITSEHVVVEGGAIWKDVITLTMEQNLLVPVMTDFKGLSVGGTLAVGGIGAAAYRHGALVDQVLELEVVDGRGELIVCSECRNRDLFDAILAGLGQCGLIVRAKVRLHRVTPMVRYSVLSYADPATFFADFKTLIAREELDFLWGSLRFDQAQARWMYDINGVAGFTPPGAPDDAHLYRGMHVDPSLVSVTDLPTLAYETFVDGAIDMFRSMGLWDGVAHPWFDVFVPGSQIETYLAEVLPTIDPMVDLGMVGFFLLFPISPARMKRPMLKVPNEPTGFLFDILTSANAPGYDPAYNQRMLDRNRRLFERARALGGTRYNIAAIPFTQRDWIRQLGRSYFDLARQKLRHDPAGILTPGPGMF